MGVAIPLSFDFDTDRDSDSDPDSTPFVDLTFPVPTSWNIPLPLQAWGGRIAFS
jgi:hypothetical protein